MESPPATKSPSRGSGVPISVQMRAGPSFFPLTSRRTPRRSESFSSSETICLSAAETRLLDQFSHDGHLGWFPPWLLPQGRERTHAGPYRGAAGGGACLRGLQQTGLNQVSLGSWKDPEPGPQDGAKPGKELTELV